MADKNKKDICAGMLDILIRGQREGKSQNEIAEGIRTGFGSDYLSLEEGVAKGSSIVDPDKYTRAMDSKGRKPRKAAPFERDLDKSLERARKRCAAETGSPEYRNKVIAQKKTQIHNEMNKRGTDEITSRIRGYDIALMRFSEIESTGQPKIKMFVNGNEIPDQQFDEALAEVAGLNDSKAFNVAAQAAMNLKEQAGIQGARAATQAGIRAATAPARAVSQASEKGNAMAGQLLRLLFQMALETSRSR